jgi:hypothetical protein
MAYVLSFIYLYEQFNLDPELNGVLTCGNAFSAFFSLLVETDCFCSFCFRLPLKVSDSFSEMYFLQLICAGFCDEWYVCVL